MNIKSTITKDHESGLRHLTLSLLDITPEDDVAAALHNLADAYNKKAQS